MTIQQLSVFAENRFGTTLSVTEALGKAGIDIRALNVADSEGFGILRMIVDDTEKAKKVLDQEQCITSVAEVLGVYIPDSPGGLSEVLRILADHQVNIEYLYAFIVKSDVNACVVLRVRDNEEVEQILTEAGIKLVSREDIQGL